MGAQARSLIRLPWSSNVDALRATLSFPAMSWMSVIVRLVYPGIRGRFGMVRRYLSSLCLKLSVLHAVSLVPYVMWHTIEEVWSMKLPFLIVLIAQLACASIFCNPTKYSLSLRYIVFYSPAWHYVA